MEPRWEFKPTPTSLPATIVQVITSPVETFRSLAPGEGLGTAAGFLIAMKTVHSAPEIIAELVNVTLQIPSPAGAIGALLSGWIGVLISQAVTIGVTSAGLIVAAMVPHIALAILQGTTRPLNDTARALAYVIGSLYLLHWIPAWGPHLAATFQLGYGAAALRGLHGCPWWKAVVGVAVAPATSMGLREVNLEWSSAGK